MLQREIEESDDPSATRRLLEKQTLLGGIAQPLDIANAAGFLLSDASRFMTGSTLTVDGGCLARVFEGGD
jgi:NAD(P)-dependent dehydrogenase (short-subunit alcohol dehydrogenase family)